MASRHELATKVIGGALKQIVATTPAASELTRVPTRIGELDGWRAISIICVIAGHWLPLGPRAWDLNTATATTGMALFFCLSGFLITRVLLTRERVPVFVIRRLFRIVPLAWAAMLILAVVNSVSMTAALANFAFFANLPPAQLMHGGNHLWSLCLEVQFYCIVALIVAVAGRRGLWLAPVGAICVTIARSIAVQPLSIVTWHRIDEILAGATLALLVYRTNAPSQMARLPNWTLLVLLVFLLLSGISTLGLLPYFRPYLAALTIGVSIFSAPAWLRKLLCSAPARYIAAISFALYVIHGMLGETWLGSGGTLQKYAKRPLLIAATWLLAHLSTFYFENPMIKVGKKVSRRFK